MNTLGRVAAAAASLAAGAAVGLVLLLPVHHTTPVSATTSGLRAGATAATASSSPGVQQSSGGSATGSTGTTGTGGAGASSSNESGGSESGSGSSSDSASGTGSGSGSSSGSGSHGVSTVHPIIPSLPHIPLPIITTVPSPTGTIGDPNVPCLMGYVWRQAYSGDYVCVTPANRSQVASDDAAASSRIQQGGGAYGPYTCIQGYVWRQVVPDDYTCVTPAVRSQAAYDNSQAGERVDLLNLWVTDWTPPAQSSQQNCSGGVCTQTEGGSDGPNFQINGDLFNLGQVLVEVRSNGGAVLWEQWVTAQPYPGFPGGALYAQTSIGDCSAVPGTTDNDYVIAYDGASGRWSDKLPIDSDCASL